MSDAQPLIEAFELGPWATNSYIVRAPGRTACWVIDPSFEPERLIARLRAEGLEPAAVVLTHAHVDHIAGVGAVVGAFPGTPVWIHEAEERWLSEPDLNLSSFAGLAVTAPGPDRLLKDGDELELEGTRWRVLHTPGHSPGGIALYCEAGGVALVGDTLFAGSVGRSDFPNSDPRVLERSIRTRLYTLPDATRVLPGHGEETSVGVEKRSNPFVRG